jgi:hypothetical protein
MKLLLPQVKKVDIAEEVRTKLDKRVMSVKTPIHGLTEILPNHVSSNVLVNRAVTAKKKEIIITSKHGLVAVVQLAFLLV